MMSHIKEILFLDGKSENMLTWIPIPVSVVMRKSSGFDKSCGSTTELRSAHKEPYGSFSYYSGPRKVQFKNNLCKKGKKWKKWRKKCFLKLLQKLCFFRFLENQVNFQGIMARCNIFFCGPHIIFFLLRPSAAFYHRIGWCGIRIHLVDLYKFFKFYSNMIDHKLKYSTS